MCSWNSVPHCPELCRTEAQNTHACVSETTMLRSYRSEKLQLYFCIYKTNKFTRDWNQTLILASFTLAKLNIIDTWMRYTNDQTNECDLFPVAVWVRTERALVIFVKSLFVFIHIQSLFFPLPFINKSFKCREPQSNRFATEKIQTTICLSVHPNCLKFLPFVWIEFCTENLNNRTVQNVTTSWKMCWAMLMQK